MIPLQNAKTPEKQANSGKVAAPVAARHTENGSAPGDLPAELIDAWPTLDDGDRNRIMAIVREARRRTAHTSQDATEAP